VLANIHALRLKVHKDKLQCNQLQEVVQSTDMSTLPNNAVVLQQHPAEMQPEGPLYAVSLSNTDKQYVAAGATFGQSLHEAGNCGQFGLEESRCDLLGRLAFKPATPHFNMATSVAIQSQICGGRLSWI